MTAMLRFSQGPVEPGGLGAGYIAIAVSDYLAVAALYNHLYECVLNVLFIA